MKQVRTFEMARYWRRRIALKIAYLGWSYQGNTTNGTPDLSQENTVEARLLEALLRMKLIESQDGCGLARCGRTDKGVSAWANVVSLTVRSNLHGAGALACSDPGLIPASEEPLKPRDEAEEMDYCRLLNRALPGDIRVLAWSPVGADFDARFNARTRMYKYYFLSAGLDLDAMGSAMKYLEGTHDFRNFCKIDVQATKTFERRIYSTRLYPASTPGVHVAEIYGKAFLWHQIRFTMAVLFHVGRGLEKPELVRDMLDLDKMPGRPEFAMASDVPLVLWQCEYDEGDLTWRQGEGREDLPNHFALYRQLHEMYEMLTLKASVVKDMMEGCAQPGDEERRQREQLLPLGQKYVPMRERKTLKTVDQRRAQLAEKEKKVRQVFR